MEYDIGAEEEIKGKKGKGMSEKYTKKEAFRRRSERLLTLYRARKNG